MSAMAGALGVELEKVGHYRLGAELASPQPGDIRRAMRLVGVVALLVTGLLMGMPLKLLSKKPQHRSARNCL